MTRSLTIGVLMAGLGVAPLAAAGSTSFTILHTNDLHGHLLPWQAWEGGRRGESRGGIARIARVVRDVRAAVGEDGVLLFDAGDTFGDTFEARAENGALVVASMNRIGFDAMALGNHDVDFGVAELRVRSGEARFPILAANVSGAVELPSSVLRTVRGLSIGIVGVGYPHTEWTTSAKNLGGMRFDAPASSTRRAVDALRAQGARVVIAITHLGLEADRRLAAEVPGIDVIVGGHSHHRLERPVQVGSTAIVQAGAHGSDVGRVDLEWTGRDLAIRRHELIPVEGESDQELARWLESRVAAHAPSGAAVVARASDWIVRAQTIRPESDRQRDRESPADDLFADAMRARTGADVALLPGVGYGVALPPGPVSRSGLTQLIPHDSPVWSMTLTGDQLRQVIEQALDNVYTSVPAGKVGGMIQVSGLRFAYRPEAKDGQRLAQATVGAEPLAPGRTYRVATAGILAEGGHRQALLREGRHRKPHGPLLDLVIEAWSGQGTVSPPPLDRVTALGVTARAEEELQ